MKIEERLNEVTLTEIAASTGVDIASLSRIFAGKRGPALSTARKLAVYFGVSVEELADYLDSLLPESAAA